MKLNILHMLCVPWTCLLLYKNYLCMIASQDRVWHCAGKLVPDRKRIHGALNTFKFSFYPFLTSIRSWEVKEVGMAKGSCFLHCNKMEYCK